MDKITMFLALKLYSHHQNKEIYIFTSLKQNNNLYLFFYNIYLFNFRIKHVFQLENTIFNSLKSSQISLEKIEIQIVLLKLQRFNNTVEKIILNKKII